MEPHIEHTFYTWLIIVAAVSIAAFIGAVIDRVRFMRVHHALIMERRRRACLKKRT